MYHTLQHRELVGVFSPLENISQTVQFHPQVRVENYTTVDPKQFVLFKIETRACDVQS